MIVRDNIITWYYKKIRTFLNQYWRCDVYFLSTQLKKRRAKGGTIHFSIILMQLIEDT